MSNSVKDLQEELFRKTETSSQTAERHRIAELFGLDPTSGEIIRTGTPGQYMSISSTGKRTIDRWALENARTQARIARENAIKAAAEEAAREKAAEEKAAAERKAIEQQATTETRRQVLLRKDKTTPTETFISGDFSGYKTNGRGFERGTIISGEDTFAKSAGRKAEQQTIQQQKKALQTLKEGFEGKEEIYTTEEGKTYVKPAVPFIGLVDLGTDFAAKKFLNLGKIGEKIIDKTEVKSLMRKKPFNYDDIYISERTAEDIISSQLKFAFFAPGMMTTGETISRLPKEESVVYKALQKEIGKDKTFTGLQFETGSGRYGQVGVLSKKLPGFSDDIARTENLFMGSISKPRVDLSTGKIVGGKYFFGKSFSKSAIKDARQILSSIDDVRVYKPTTITGQVAEGKIAFPGRNLKFNAESFGGRSVSFPGLKDSDVYFSFGETGSVSGRTSSAGWTKIMKDILNPSDNVASGISTGLLKTAKPKPVTDVSKIVESVVSKTATKPITFPKIFFGSKTKIRTTPKVKKKPGTISNQINRDLNKATSQLIFTKQTSKQKSRQGQGLISLGKINQQEKQLQKDLQVSLTRTKQSQKQSQKQRTRQQQIARQQERQLLKGGFGFNVSFPKTRGTPLFFPLLFPKPKYKPKKSKTDRKLNEALYIVEGFTGKLFGKKRKIKQKDLLKEAMSLGEAIKIRGRPVIVK